MKKKIFCFLSCLCLLSSCNLNETSKNNENTNTDIEINNEDKCDYNTIFCNTEFTLDTFVSYVKSNGFSKYNSISGKIYYIPDYDLKNYYKNDSVKKLLTSANCDLMYQRQVYVDGLWNLMYEEIFSNDIIFTTESLFNTIKEKCVWSAKNSYGSTYYFIGEATDYMSKNESIVSLCKGKGYDIFYKLLVNFSLYKQDLIDLYIKTDTWIDNNTNIGVWSDYSGYHPFAFEKLFWECENWDYEGNGYGFGNASSYVKMVNVIKDNFKDFNSYNIDEKIEFYSESNNATKNGYYIGLVYTLVPFKWNNAFGESKIRYLWLKYDWNYHNFYWYGETTPSSINKYPFETRYID